MRAGAARIWGAVVFGLAVGCGGFRAAQDTADGGPTPMGATGDPGDPGDGRGAAPGAAGAAGSPSAAGTPGSGGAAGTAGTPDAATPGTAGTPGGAGTAGSAGTSGTPGTAGSSGSAGTGGTPGSAGTAGAAGTAGGAGSAGAPGSAGAAGTPGAAGAPGAAGTTGDGGAPGGGGAGDGGASSPCRPFELACLDPSAADVIEVPTESTLANALAAAKAGDTIQMRAGTLTGTGNLPPYVTLRGCQGARLDGTVRFAGSGGTVEGFAVGGALVANASGDFVVRRNRFDGASTVAGFSARAVDGLVGAQISAIVEDNLFVTRASGIEARTYYDTATRTVDLVVRNNVFHGVANPLTLSEAGIVGRITARIEHNTLHDFQQGVRIYAVAARLVTTGNLFANGVTAFDADVAFEAHYTLFSDVVGSTPPAFGVPAVGSARFVDRAAGDLRLGPGSAAIDAVAASAQVPGLDHVGCPRPRAMNGGAAKADIGALEMQP